MMIKSTKYYGLVGFLSGLSLVTINIALELSADVDGGQDFYY